MSNAIEMLIDPRSRSIGSGTVRRLLPYRARRMVGPFVFADLMGPEDVAPGDALAVDAHPHIGISTLTYLLEGRIVHRDSTGAVQTIEPGAVNWMTAGSGVTHTERSDPADIGQARSMHGAQLWVALPDESEEVAPSFQHMPAAAAPVEQWGRSSVRVAAGTGWGMASPVMVSSPLVLAEVRLDPTSPVPIESDLRELAVLSVDGEVRVGDTLLDDGQLAVLDADARPTISGQGTALVLGGDPVGKRHIWWNFVHSDPDRIEEAKRAWLAQEFPLVPGDHEPFVPLPGSGPA